MTKALPDHYQTLGVSPEATHQEIKAAFRRLAKKHHPDLSKLPATQAEALFHSINAAWEVLGDPDRKKEYDRSRRTSPSDKPRSSSSGVKSSEGTQSAHVEDGFPDFSRMGIRSFDDLVEYKFQQQQAAERKEPDTTESHTKASRVEIVSLTYREAYFGTEKDVSIYGRVVRIRTPPGVRDGSVLRLPGSFSEVQLSIKLKQHAYFQMANGDLLLEFPITKQQARLGARILVPYPEGTLTLTVPQGTKHGQILRCRAKGWPNGKAISDLKVRIVVSSSSEATVAQQQQLILKVGF